jgi:hypothetical protein
MEEEKKQKTWGVASRGQSGFAGSEWLRGVRVGSRGQSGFAGSEWVRGVRVASRGQSGFAGSEEWLRGVKAGFRFSSHEWMPIGKPEHFDSAGFCTGMRIVGESPPIESRVESTPIQSLTPVRRAAGGSSPKNSKRSTHTGKANGRRIIGDSRKPLFRNTFRFTWSCLAFQPDEA